MCFTIKKNGAGGFRENVQIYTVNYAKMCHVNNT